MPARYHSHGDMGLYKYVHGQFEKNFRIHTHAHTHSLLSFSFSLFFLFRALFPHILLFLEEADLSWAGPNLLCS